MDASIWQARFTSLWPLLKAFDLPEYEVFHFRDWRAAFAEAGRPEGRKPMLAFNVNQGWGR
jgi:hypothetical protein